MATASTVLERPTTVQAQNKKGIPLEGRKIPDWEVMDRLLGASV